MKVQTTLIKEGKVLVSNLARPIAPDALRICESDGVQALKDYEQANKTFESSFVEVSKVDDLEMLLFAMKQEDLSNVVGFRKDGYYQAPTGLEMEVKRVPFKTEDGRVESSEKVALITFQSPLEAHQTAPLEGKEEKNICHQTSKPCGYPCNGLENCKPPSTVDKSGEGELYKLQKFKAYVHARLDEAGVPFDPEPENNHRHGCRIEGRLNYILKSDNDGWISVKKKN